MNISESEKINAVVKMGTALHKLGTNAYRTEAALSRISHALGLKGQFFFTPTYLLASFETEDGEQGRHVRVKPGKINLEKLSEVDALGDDLIASRLPVRLVVERIEEIMARAERYPMWLMILCFMLVSGAISTLLTPSVPNFLGSLLLGACTGFWFSLSEKYSKVEDLYEAFAALTVTLVAGVLNLYYPTINIQLAVLAGVISILPGLSLTIATAELATNHLASGTSRLMGAITSLMKISFGVALGVKITGLFFHPLYIESALLLPGWVEYVGLFFCALGFTIMFYARPIDFPIVIFAAVLGVLGTRLGIKILDPTMGSFLGGILIGAASNGFARYFNRPAMLIQLPGIILSVPGGIGYRSLSSMFEHDVIKGLGFAFDAGTVALSLVAGLFFGNLLINPRRTL